MLVYSKDEVQHTNHLRIVLQISRKHQLYDKLKKCEFWLEDGLFLGHVVFKEAIKANHQKVNAIIY